MTHIHWLGAGLSSIPGIRRIASSNKKITVWNRTLSKAEFSINHTNSKNAIAKKFDINKISLELKEGDIVVSQLPANMHIIIAKICLEKNCHFISSSYISADIKDLQSQVNDKGLIFINEMSLVTGYTYGVS